MRSLETYLICLVIAGCSDETMLRVGDSGAAIGADTGGADAGGADAGGTVRSSPDGSTRMELDGGLAMADPDLFVATDGADANPCTRDAPCATFDRAYRAALPGQVVEVGPGSYPLQRIERDASKSAPAVVFQPAPSARVTLAGFDIGDNYTGETAQHIEVRSMEIVPEVHVGFGNVDQDITFRDIDTDRIVFTSAKGVRWYGGDIGPNVDGVSHINNCGTRCPGTVGPRDILIDGARFHDFLISDPEPHAECIMLWGNDTDGVTIRNSTFERCTDFDIFVKAPGSRNIVIENNFLDEPMPGDRATTACAPGCPRGGNAVRLGDYAYPSSIVRYNTALGGLGADVEEPTLVTRGNVARRTSCWGLKGVHDHNVWSGAACSPTDAQQALEEALFDADPSDGTMDLHLRAGAVAIDRGDPTDFPIDDVDGARRPSGAAPDVGADEHE